MGKCEAPIHTSCLILLWLLIIPGLLLTHIAIGNLVEPVTDLPDNIVTGFDNVFKFASLEADSGKLKTESTTALNMCSLTVVSTTTCNAYDITSTAATSTQVDTTTQKAEIVKIFDNSLAIVTRVTNDKYFGIDGMKNTGNELTKITNELDKISGTMPCSAVVPAYCAIWESSGAIIDGMGSVNAAIDSFKNGEQIKDYKDNAGFFTFLHVLPYFGAIALLCFTLFHWKAGICCCCSGGSKCACLALLPFFLFWLASFIIYLIVVAIGIVVRTQQENVNVSMLNGNPTLKDAIEHVQTAFPEFWDVVFEDMESALAQLFTAAFFFTIWNILTIVFSFCECCCRPFKQGYEEKQGSQ